MLGSVDVDIGNGTVNTLCAVEGHIDSQTLAYGHHVVRYQNAARLLGSLPVHQIHIFIGERPQAVFDVSCDAHYVHGDGIGLLLGGDGDGGGCRGQGDDVFLRLGAGGRGRKVVILRSGDGRTALRRDGDRPDTGIGIERRQSELHQGVVVGVQTIGGRAQGAQVFAAVGQIIGAQNGDDALAGPEEDHAGIVVRGETVIGNRDDNVIPPVPDLIHSAVDKVGHLDGLSGRQLLLLHIGVPFAAGGEQMGVIGLEGVGAVGPGPTGVVVPVSRVLILPGYIVPVEAGQRDERLSHPMEIHRRLSVGKIGRLDGIGLHQLRIAAGGADILHGKLLTRRQRLLGVIHQVCIIDEGIVMDHEDPVRLIGAVDLQIAALVQACVDFGGKLDNGGSGVLGHHEGIRVIADLRHRVVESII